MKTISLAEEYWEAMPLTLNLGIREQDKGVEERELRKKKFFDLAVEKEIKPNKSNNNVLNFY